jgi:hypothetical protein
LRLIGASAVLLGAAWLSWVHPSPRAWASAVLASVVALYWIGASFRSRRQARTLGMLHLRPDALVLESDADIARVEWSRVRAIEVDEERLVVRVEREGEEPLIIEPLWRGVGVDELARAIDEARIAALGDLPGPSSKPRSGW